jgi:hypothetical protein
MATMSPMPRYAMNGTKESVSYPVRGSALSAGFTQLRNGEMLTTTTPAAATARPVVFAVRVPVVVVAPLGAVVLLMVVLL